MGITKTGSLGMLVLGLALVGGCASSVTLPDGTEVPKDEYRASQQEAHAVSVAEKLSAMIQDCPADMTEKEASECRWSNAMTMVVMPQIAANLTPSGYWQHRTAKRQFWLDVAGLALNNPFTQAFAYGRLGGGGGSVKITADGQSHIENIDMTTGDGSPFVTGSDNMTAVDEGQNLGGDGLNSRSTTRPFFQPQPNTEGGDIDNMSEGFSAGIDAP